MPYTKLSNLSSTYTFDDVQLIPRYSDISSRKNCDTSTDFTKNYKIDIPIIASPMQSICEYDMAYAMWRLGGVGIIHRFNTIDEQVEIVSSLQAEIDHDISNYKKSEHDKTLYRFKTPVISAAIGAKEQDIYRARALVEAGVNVLLIDIAHGHHSSTKHTLEELAMLKTSSDFKFDVIAGNIATSQAAEDLEEWGADALRVGIGGGSVCETRIRTGVGIPQISCLYEIGTVADTPVISCGGIRYPGDVAKALGAGATTVMLGSMLSGTEETPGDIMHFGKYGKRQMLKIYHGSASDVQKRSSSYDLNNIEGTATTVPYKGGVEGVVNEIMDGFRSAMSYVGANDMTEFYANCNFVKVTTNGLQEALPHLL